MATHTSDNTPLHQVPQSLHPASSMQLAEAFELFQRVSDDLGSSYHELEAQVAKLSAELTSSRSERLRELAEKEKLADKLSTLMAALPAAVVVLNLDDVVEECNPAAQSMLGDSLSGRLWSEILRDNTAGKPIYAGELDTLDGRRLALVSSPLANDDARIVLLTDITQSHQLNALLHREQRLRELGDMAARLAHQLRTPLSSALLYLAQLELSDLHPQRRADTTEKVRERLRHIERLTDGMLTYIKGRTVAPDTFSMTALVTEIGEAMSPQMKSAGAQFDVSLPDVELRITGEREALCNALFNLLDNALQSCPDNAVIQLELSQCEKFIHVRVTDNGPGIEPAIRERIFDPYFSTRAHGTGLGLAVVASAVEAHGGTITLENEAIGGSVFHIIIPETALDNEELLR